MKSKKRARKDKGRISIEERTAFLVQLLRETPGKSYTLTSLAQRSGGDDTHGRHDVKRIMAGLVEQGFAVRKERGHYSLNRTNMPHYEGVVDMNSNGTIFVQCESLETDVFIHNRNSHCALHGDRVEVVVTYKSRNGALEGEVVRIVERSRKCYVGVAEVRSKSSIVIIPSTRRLPAEVYLSRRHNPKINDGDKVAFRISEWREQDEMPTAEVVELLGTEGENEAEMHAILLEYDLPYKFERKVEEAAEAIDGRITEKDYAERRDMRQVPTLTIDPADAKDFDDALSVRPVGEGKWEVGVHIADVTHYVREGSIIDDEAVERATSVYLVDRTVPMLPERLCNDLCSLRPHEEKLSFSAIFTITEDLKIESEWFGRTVIYSDRRFTYEEAQRVIESGEGDMKEEILTLHRLAQGLREERYRKGAIAFDRREAKFTLDDEGHPTGVYFKVQKEANQLIEEFMLLANKRVATFCARRNGKPRTMVFRVHDEPNSDKFERFRNFILRFGHILRAQKGTAVAKELNKLLRDVHGKAEENVVSIMAIRSMAKAVYTTDNIGHYGLGFPYYTHFTSPIRRYPDMMVHRLLQRYLDGGRSADKSAYEALCEHSSDMEVRAAEAERASIKYKMVEFMADKVGEEFDGHISGLSEWGIFVELEDSIVEGMVLMRDIPGDYYRFDEARYEVYGQATGRTFSLGDKVRIKVKSADLRRRLLDFTLVKTPFGEVDEQELLIHSEPKHARRR
ncbi:MAG: ribonuclease R [Alistipes sp.]|nr:ribonuclease R [Alistipes sp.]